MKSQFIRHLELFWSLEEDLKICVLALKESRRLDVADTISYLQMVAKLKKRDRTTLLDLLMECMG